jgi:hypothetical protein
VLGTHGALGRSEEDRAAGLDGLHRDALVDRGSRAMGRDGEAAEQRARVDAAPRLRPGDAEHGLAVGPERGTGARPAAVLELPDAAEAEVARDARLVHDMPQRVDA